MTEQNLFTMLPGAEVQAQWILLEFKQDYLIKSRVKVTDCTNQLLHALSEADCAKHAALVEKWSSVKDVLNEFVAELVDAAAVEVDKLRKS